MPTSSTSPPPPALADDELRGQTPKAPSDLAEAIDQTVRLWRKHHLTYDQTKYLVEQTRRRLSCHHHANESGPWSGWTGPKCKR